MVKELSFIGDPSVNEFEGKRLVYVAAGKDPYRLVEDSVKYALLGFLITYLLDLLCHCVCIISIHFYQLKSHYILLKC